MTPEPDDLTDVDPEHVRVLRWRYDRLKNAGFHPRNAYDLAESGCDVRRAEDLLTRGCPEHYAVLILL